MRLIDDKTDFSAYLAEPEGQERVRPAGEFVDAVISRFSTPAEMQGLSLPWPKTNQQFRIRANELTLWNGFSGHGKSLLIGQVMLNAMTHGERVLIASMEMKPETTLQRMTRQAVGTSTPTTDEIRNFVEWTNDRLWIYDRFGSAPWKKLVAVCRYACAELGVTQIVIDSMMRCGIPDDDYAQQKQFLDALTDFKMAYKVHIHLVVHARKKEDESAPPGKLDIKGGGTVSDLADNVVSAWRNKAKGIAMQQAHYQRTKADVTVLDKPDAQLNVDKQRNGEWEGRINLWFLPDSTQFVENGVTSAPMAVALKDWPDAKRLFDAAITSLTEVEKATEKKCVRVNGHDTDPDKILWTEWESIRDGVRRSAADAISRSLRWGKAEGGMQLLPEVALKLCSDVGLEGISELRMW